MCVLCKGLGGVVDIGEDLHRGLCKVVGNGADLDVRRRRCGKDKGGWGAATCVPKVGDTVDGRHVEEALVGRK